MIKGILMLTFLLNFFRIGYSQNQHKTVKEQNIYEFKMKSISGEEIDFAQFKGKKLLIVNVASECGFTPQYEGLQELHEKYGDKVAIIGVPANDFGKQEPGSAEEIQKFCKVNYGVTFLITEKVSVKGETMHPLYVWLSSIDLNGVNDKAPNWNFCKYLIDENGTIVSFFPSMVKPMSDKIVGNL